VPAVSDSFSIRTPFLAPAGTAYRVGMETVSAQSESSVRGAHSVEAEFVRTELELAFSLLDVAIVSEKSKIVRGCVHNAVTAVRAAARFLASAADHQVENADISRSQDALVKRVREVARQRRSRPVARSAAPAA
jgi:hypothetical protein